jgi:hypothetical protein
MKNLKYFIPEIFTVLVVIAVLVYCCTNEPVCVHNTPGSMMIIPSDTVEGRPTYTILFEDEKGLDHMYGEEIGNSLATGKWAYDEDLTITTEK